MDRITHRFDSYAYCGELRLSDVYMTEDGREPDKTIMYCEQEAPTCLSDEFVQALRLVHSSEPGSADALRALLDASIAQRYGSDKTTLARPLPPHLYREESREPSELSDEEATAEMPGEATAAGFTDSGGNDVGAGDEVPRISIPDEDQSDGVVCKVCNVAEFGPLILVQCTECGDLYHPLCHQPPIVDACVAGKDLSWRCSECDRKFSLVNELMRSDMFKDSTWIRGDNIKKYSKKGSKKIATSKIGKR